jgi:hypothetical protein
LHNSGEKLCNFCVTDNNESLARSMTDRYIDEEGNERIEQLWEELVPEEGDEVEWNEKDVTRYYKAAGARVLVRRFRFHVFVASFMITRLSIVRSLLHYSIQQDSKSMLGFAPQP